MPPLGRHPTPPPMIPFPGLLTSLQSCPRQPPSALGFTLPPGPCSLPCPRPRWSPPFPFFAISGKRGELSSPEWGCAYAGLRVAPSGEAVWEGAKEGRASVPGRQRGALRALPRVRGCGACRASCRRSGPSERRDEGGGADGTGMNAQSPL